MQLSSSCVDLSKSVLNEQVHVPLIPVQTNSVNSSPQHRVLPSRPPPPPARQTTAQPPDRPPPPPRAHLKNLE
ncbi:hypothetical protein Ciccas_002396 [Cichlidogyrus casuarinus]|uniref:Uncharacterized protein n=1 Tax=Cichlidogyrus casuarinus TaxID=1844966 RepID=A0ABD2QHQ8_9PLAT